MIPMSALGGYLELVSLGAKMFSMVGVLRVARSLIYFGARRFFSLKTHTVLLQSGGGQGFYGNPYYLAKHLISDAAYEKYRVICVVDSKSVKFLSELRSKRSRFCSVGSLAYIFNLATAKYVIGDTSFPIWFVRREAQRYLNTWHGTPLKTLGKRSAIGVHANLRNMQRNFFQCTDVLAPNLHTLKILQEDFMLQRVWGGRCIEKGYPRNDVLFCSRERVGNWNNIAFMPTWRGTHADPKAYSEDIQGFLDILAEGLPDSIFWVRLHPLVQRAVSIRYDEHVRAFPIDKEPYEHLANCDILITDYSSVMFDFSITSRPVVLYVPDINGYREERDFCFDISLLPFPIMSDGQAVVQALSRQVGDLDQSEEFRSLIKSESGRSAQEVCSIFFNDDPFINRNVNDKTALFMLPHVEHLAVSLIDCARMLCREGWSVVLCVDEQYEEPRAINICREEAGCSLVPATEDKGTLVWQRLVYNFLTRLSFRTAKSFRRNRRFEEWKRLFGHDYSPLIAVVSDEGVGARLFSPMNMRTQYFFVSAKKEGVCLDEGIKVIEIDRLEGERGRTCERIYSDIKGHYM